MEAGDRQQRVDGGEQHERGEPGEIAQVRRGSRRREQQAESQQWQRRGEEYGGYEREDRVDVVEPGVEVGGRECEPVERGMRQCPPSSGDRVVVDHEQHEQRHQPCGQGNRDRHRTAQARAPDAGRDEWCRECHDRRLADPERVTAQRPGRDERRRRVCARRGRRC